MPELISRPKTLLYHTYAAKDATTNDCCAPCSMRISWQTWDFSFLTFWNGVGGLGRNAQVR